LADYVTLATSQTITGFKQFTTRPIFQQGIQANQNIVCESIGGGGQQSIIVQDNAGLFIRNVDISNSINLETRTAAGANVVNLSCANGNSTTIRGSLTMENEGIIFKDVGLGASFTQVYQTGVQLAVVPNHNSSVVSLYTRTAGGVLNENIRCANGNSTIITGTDCTIACDNFKSNAPFECGYLQLATPITTKTNYDIGYVWSILGTTFTSWNGYIITPGNVVTIAWNGTGDKTLGVWLVEIILTTNSATTIDTNLNWNTVSGTSMTVNHTCCNMSGITLHNSTTCNILRMSFVLNVTNTTTTYYLNFLKAGGSALSDNTGGSRIQFTRIA